MSAEAAGRARRRWVGWVLAASVCLNLALLGLAAGAFLRHGPGAPGRETPAGFDGVTLWRIYKDLPEAGRETVDRVVDGIKPRLRTLRDARAESREAIAAAISAEPFDPDALATALAAARIPEREARATVDAAFVRLSAGFSPETRAEIAETLREAGRRGRRRRHDD